MIPFIPRVRRATTDPMSMRVASTNMNNPARLPCIGALGWAVLISTIMVSCVGGVPDIVPHMSVPIYQEGLMSLYSDGVSRVFTTLDYYLGTSTQDNDKLYDLYYRDYYRDLHLRDTRQTCYADLDHLNLDVISGKHFPDDQCELDLVWPLRDYVILGTRNDRTKFGYGS